MPCLVAIRCKAGLVELSGAIAGDGVSTAALTWSASTADARTDSCLPAPSAEVDCILTVEAPSVKNER